MDKNEIRDRLIEMVTPVCEARGISIWGIELLFGAGGPHKVVRVFLDSPEGVGIDECTAVSRHLSLTLDVEDIIPGAYNLEVSSPGLERPFFSPDQLTGYVGQTIRLRLYTPQDGRKNFKGRLESVDGNAFTLVDGKDSFTLQWEDVSKANLVYEHPGQGKPGK